MSDKYQMENRKFLHDMATPVSILRLLIKRLTAAQEGTGPEADKERIKEFLQRAAAAIDSIETLHADFKSALAERELEVPTNKAA